MPDLGAHIPGPNGNCEGHPFDDTVPWPCAYGWQRLLRQYPGALVAVEWNLLTYLAGQLVWAGQQNPRGDAGDIAAQIIRHLEPARARHPQHTAGVGGLYGANSGRWA